MDATVQEQTQQQCKEGLMRVVTAFVEFDTPGNAHIQRITDEVAQALKDSGLAAGTVTVFAPGATAAITTLEFEPGVVHDVQEFLDTVIPPEKDYQHNANLGDGNAHSHIRAGLLGPSLAVPFVDGRMTLGRWQEIVFCDFDARSRSRRAVVQIMGV
jgi:secondary thiamine-phosphate synthase enzyme